VIALAYMAAVYCCAGLACGHHNQDLRAAAAVIVRVLRGGEP
jgi:hypothetical protein